MACSHCRNLDQEEYREWDWHNGSWNNGSWPLSKTSVHNILEPINPVPSPCPVRFPCSVNTPLMTNLEFRGFLNHYLVWIGNEKLNINFAHFTLDSIFVLRSKSTSDFTADFLRRKIPIMFGGSRPLSKNNSLSVTSAVQ